MKAKNDNIAYYLAAALIFILLKLGYTFADNDSLNFLLRPTDKLVGLLTGSQSAYFAGQGYYHGRLNILIDKSCSGFNFWALSFLVFTYLALKYIGRPLYKGLVLLLTLVFAYILTIFVNSSRIYSAIIVQRHTKDLLLQHQSLVHESVGIIINLSFLILVYFLIEKFLISRQHHAEAA